MTASKSLPAHPSLESLRKQAKRLARDIAAGDAGAIARVRAQLPNIDLPLTQRNAQLAIAREYGYAGWQDVTAEVSRRLGNGLEWAVLQARHVIHDNDVERLRQLLAESPALLSWRADPEDGGLLRMATGAYGDAGTPEREEWFTRAASAEVLIDAGAVVTPYVTEGILRSRARGLLQLFHRKGLLPRTLKFHAALGDMDGVHSALDEVGSDFATVNEAFVRGTSFGHSAVASLLLDRQIAIDPELGATIDAGMGRQAFVRYFIEKGAGDTIAVGPWKAFVMQQVGHALHEGDLTGFVQGLKRDAWLLDDAFVEFQNGLISTAAYVHFEKPRGGPSPNDRVEFIRALLDLGPAIVRRQPPPRSQAIEYAITYGNTHLVPILARIWPVPDDLPHAAGMGNLARVKQWFDVSGALALDDPRDHMPHTSPHQETFDDWGVSPEQKVLDTALAWAVINHHFDIADFLLEHGADISTKWNSHEPASILHHLVFEDDYDAMQFLIDRGIDMTIKDYRWDSNAIGWARYGKRDEKLAQWLEEAQRRREQQSR
jgi:hypothetical protein